MDQMHEWGLVWNMPSREDLLLGQTYSKQDTAIRMAMFIARQFVAQHVDHERLMLEVHKSSQNVVSVSSKITGKPYMTVRPVRVASYLAGGHAVAPAETNAMISAWLDSDTWNS